MTLLLVIPVLALLSGILLVIFFNYWGVLLASILTALASAWIQAALSGMGNPTGYAPPFNFLHFIFRFSIYLPFCLLFFFGTYFFRNYFSASEFPKHHFLIWAGIVLFSGLAYTSHKIYLNISKKNFDLRISFDSDNPLTWQDVSAHVNGKLSKSEGIFFNVGGGSYIAGSRKIHFNPQRIDVVFFGEEKVLVQLPANSRQVTMDVSKDFLLKTIADGNLIDTRQLKPWRVP